MARVARKKSETGIYHIMLRGIDGRDIFLDTEDKSKFLDKLLTTKKNVNFKLYGYCLMDNHIHLLMQEAEDIGTSIKRITVGYVHWHNNKYGRSGHLFQNRYLSEPVETERYLLAVLRYIHQNPQKAIIVKQMNDYLWSSYNQYLALYNGQAVHIDGALIKAYFKSSNEFIKFMNEHDDQVFLEYKQVKRYTDNMLRTTIEKEFNVAHISDLSMETRNKKIKEMYERTGASIRQLGRVLGVGKGVIENALKQDR
jgi:REP element-mobilizing transposase RayT